MYLFSFAALPVFTLGIYFLRSKESRKSYLPPVLAGFISSAIYCFLEAFFFLPSHIWVDSFSSNFVNLLLTQELLPSVILTGLFFFFSKDSFDYKFNSILPLLSSFYSVFIPYKYFISGLEPSFFYLFIKVMLYISLLIFISVLLISCYRLFCSKKIVAGCFFVLFIIAAFAVPPLMEVIWFFNISSIIYLALSALYVAGAIFVFIKSKFLFEGK